MSHDSPTQLPPESTDTGSELPPELLTKLRVEVPGYQLLDELGTGGQATVYRATELTSGLTVAIKILHGGRQADDAARERFRRETAALKAINHPNIVCVIEAGRTPAGLDYLVMNFVDGKPLDVLWKDRKLAGVIAPDPSSRLRLFKRICDVVQSAHRRGITHRDLSPSNITLDTEGAPHILDFGLAATAFDHLNSPANRNVTMTGQFIGKLKYASPEQARGSRDSIDIRTDVYALGVILYQIVTDGAFPYEVVGNVVDVLNNIIHSKPTLPSAILARREQPAISNSPAQHRPVRRGPSLVNPTIEAIVLKALEKDPNQRYESAGALAADIENYLAGRPTAAKLASPTPVETKRRSNRKLIATCGFAVTAIFLMGVIMNARTVAAWLGITLASTAATALPPELDPGVKLDTARETYERSVEAIRANIDKVFGEKEDALRSKSGTDDAIDKIVEQRAAFAATGEIPTTLGVKAQLAEYQTHRKALIAAYNVAGDGYKDPKVKLDELRKQMRKESSLLDDENDLNSWGTNAVADLDAAKRTLDGANPVWTISDLPNTPYRVEVAGKVADGGEVSIEVPTLDGKCIALPARTTSAGAFHVVLTVREGAVSIDRGVDRQAKLKSADESEHASIHVTGGKCTLEKVRVKPVLATQTVVANGEGAKQSDTDEIGERQESPSKPDPAAALTAGSKWLSKDKSKIWTVNSRNETEVEMETPSIQGQGSVVVSFLIQGNKLTVTKVAHVGTRIPMTNKDWSGKGSVSGNKLKFSFRAQYKADAGKQWKHWNVTMDGELMD